ncbi:MAG: 3-hydroxyacyl-CoA dehydrogenase [Gammaproteobacteria bacterium]|nr:3-hydroxyacyl-CoA dehydrogenase [Gammaproteobacteria bacterium]NIN37772.1 3-hydroxyacyl-CoA dehydrogenase [Gammaproteobacteria bacterium]NIO23432.1 3-hydroxyacyl-CoA dehydrogenase [Gammaproteobacteria bacterium]NIO64048.1 3-hydroxyacyl-CoA dehydrogenase [Gammaproteobacteria bacterium]NIP63061.1 3-hydroxyacyl-CoA dehydrogenase [Gammaproteobacteria bacterium]
MARIEKAAVIGAGTMGSGIASHLANAGVPVVMLDIASEGEGGRSRLAERAVERLLDSSPPAFMHPDNARLINTGNIEDDLASIADADWIAEAVVERLDVKKTLYAAIDAVRAPGSIVSSNTSTIPLSMLTEDMSESLKRDFCITHFFNPVRYMRLLELVRGPDTRVEVIDTLTEFCDVALGKGVVPCSDTPGFLGNRVGVFALQVGIVEAARGGLTVEEADAIMGRPMGIPKTGVFGLYDLIGLDLMLDVVASLRSALAEDDPFQEVADGISAVADLVARGQTGNKGGAGFYREGRDSSGSGREALDLASGDYRPATRPQLAAAQAGENNGLRALVEYPDKYGDFAWRVLSRTLSYAASLLPEVGTSILPVDEAMKLGYSWSRGPFEMIDALGTAWFRERLLADGIPVPAILEKAGDATLYRAAVDHMEHLGFDGRYHRLTRAPGIVRLGDIKRVGKAIIGNEAASLWDVGDGVACLEFHTKANALSPDSMRLLRDAVSVVEDRFTALLVHNDAPHFSVGFNLEFALANAKARDWDALDQALREFQDTTMAIKHAPFPVVGAPAGTSLGGGFEVLLHCDALQAHTNTVMGQVETLVGLVPSGGGCKELLHRWCAEAGSTEAVIAGALKVFELIGMGKTASSPIEAEPYRFFLARDCSTMNRDRLLVEAKKRAIAMADGYEPPARSGVPAAGPGGRQRMQTLLEKLDERGITTPHDQVVGRHLAEVLCGGGAPAGEIVSDEELCALEREAFITLAGTPATVARIEHMLDTGRPLRN